MELCDSILDSFLDRLAAVRKDASRDEAVDLCERMFVNGDRNFGFAHGMILRHTIVVCQRHFGVR